MQRSKGFTLIELLVVIAIIAILAAILFPVFAQAREKARAITCVSNTKQVALGVMMYLQDYDETFPIAWGEPNGFTWYLQVDPYIKSPTGIDNITKLQSGDLMSGVWHCPDDTDGPATQSFTSNAMLLGVVSGSWEYAPPKTLAAVNAPAQIVLAGEGVKDWWPDCSGILNGGGTNGTGPGYCDANTNWLLPADDGLDENSVAAAQMYQQWLKDYDWTDYQDLMINCPSTYAYFCKYPKFRHSRNGQKTGLVNLAHVDGHVKTWRWGQMKIENWFPQMTDAQAAYNN